MNIVEFIQASGANYTAGRGGRAIDGMAVHYTATSASAHNNLVYFSRPGAGASAHLFVDKDGAIRQSVRLEDTAWAVGDFAENQRTVSVEVVSAGEDFTDAQVAALAEIYAYLRATYGITRVIRHYDVTGKRCPAPYVDAGKWAALRARITGGGFGAAAGGGNGGSAPSGSVAELAQAVIQGDYGNGDARRGALGSRYDEVQAEVNRILGGGTATGGSSSGGAGADIEALAQAVIRGDYGNGDARRAALGASYDAVQARVNEILGAGGSSSGGSGGADIEALAQAVIRGEYGNGDERRRRLGSLYDAVQARVNEILL
ncbi:N-acetylmuramoyl-L-alanine amidase [Enorma phocaeensis]|uniref:N-acetylmuramoyl-L-alanine amidase n=1 Tax=Enorma phocaeensis TaxID=1871019 RepID=UPI00320B1278